MNLMAIGANLRVLRGSRTQKEVANALGVSKAAISYYENGQKMPSADHMVALANFYGRSVQQLFFKPEYTKRTE